MLYGEGSLFWLIVRVQGTTGITSPLNLREFIPGVGGSVLYAPEDLSSPIPLRLENGVFHVGNACTLGYLNGNSAVEAVDAYLALQIASGRLTPTPEQSQCGDVNGNGRIDSADASMILYYAAHGYWPTVEQDANLARAADVSPLAIKLDPAVGAPGSTVAVTLRAENMPEMAGGEFVFAYNRMLIDAITVQPAGLASGFKLEARDDGAGLLHIALADVAPISGAGALAILRLHLASNAQRGDVS